MALPPTVHQAVEQCLHRVGQRHQVPQTYNHPRRKVKPKGPQQKPVYQVWKPAYIKGGVDRKKFESHCIY